MDIIQWKVAQVVPETRETITYVLEPLDGKPVKYEAGQFLTFLFEHHGQELRRSYSMSSTPGIDEHISVTVKRKVNGAISRYIQLRWRKGTIVRTIQPTGMFRIDTDTNAKRTFLFIAAGSGIVPIFSLLKKVLHFEPKSRVILINQNFDEDRIIFREALLGLEKRFGERFKLINLLSNPSDHSVAPQRLNNTLLEQMILQTGVLSDRENTFFYTCGPLLFMKMVEFTVRVMGFEGSQVRKENFTIESIPTPRFTMESVPRQVTVQYGSDRYEFTTTYPSNILQSALDNHITLPYSCRAGRCSSCVAKCVSGSVKMSVNDVLTEKDLADGLVLTCVGYAETDVVLEF
jgi:Flavodoxin reductases (ferredoxin-NADPH reductases) family 1